MSEIREIFEKVRKMKAEGRTVFDFTLGTINTRFREAESAVLKAARELIESDDSKNPFSYLPSLGPDYTQEAAAKFMSRTHGIGFKPEDAVICSGAAEATKISMICLDGDIIIPEPAFPPAYEWPKTHKEIRRVKTDEKFHLDVERIREELKDGKSRIVYISNPCNPTGIIFGENEMKDLVEALESTGSWLIVDGVYSHMTWDGKTIPNEYLKRYNNVILTDSVSKTYGLLALRGGWLVFHPDVDTEVKEKVKLKMQEVKERGAHVCPSVIACKALTKLVEIDSDRIREHHQRTSGRRIDMFFEGLNGYANKSDATIYAWLPIPEGEKNDVEFADRLLKDYGIAAIPGSGFGCPGYLRFSVGGISKSDIKEAMPLIRKVYKIS